MALLENLLTVGILLLIALLAYLKMTNKTLIDFFRELKEIIATDTEEVLVR